MNRQKQVQTPKSYRLILNLCVKAMSNDTKENNYCLQSWCAKLLYIKIVAQIYFILQLLKMFSDFPVNLCPLNTRLFPTVSHNALHSVASSPATVSLHKSLIISISTSNFHCGVVPGICLKPKQREWDKRSWSIIQQPFTEVSANPSMLYWTNGSSRCRQLIKLYSLHVLL